MSPGGGSRRPGGSRKQAKAEATSRDFRLRTPFVLGSGQEGSHGLVTAQRARPVPRGGEASLALRLPTAAQPPAPAQFGPRTPPLPAAVTQAGAVFSLLACGSVEKIFHELLAPTLIFFFPLGHKVIGDHPSSSDGSGQAWALSAAPWRSEVRGSARPGAMFRHSPPSVKNSRQPVGGR